MIPRLSKAWQAVKSWFEPPSIRDAFLPDGQPRIGSRVRVRVELTGRGMMTVLFHAPQAVGSQRFRISADTPQVEFVVPAGLVLRFRFANLWGSSEASIDIEPSELVLDLNRFVPQPQRDPRVARIVRSALVARAVRLKTIKAGVSGRILTILKRPATSIVLPPPRASRVTVPLLRDVLLHFQLRRPSVCVRIPRAWATVRGRDLQSRHSEYSPSE